MSDFKARMHKIRSPLGLRPRPRWESLQRSPSPLAVFKGPTSKGRAGKEEGEGKGRKMEREANRRAAVRGWEGREGEGQAAQYFGVKPPLVILAWFFVCVETQAERSCRDVTREACKTLAKQRPVCHSLSVHLIELS